ncbi:GM22679 [Drosophila sechellia]|uniref:GM22679 n=1 Tax=Drosophila sechellia TaxID=7238 RepID=B4I665_DROSE|nr:GM22679 [Drosophila sechellia]
MNRFAMCQVDEAQQLRSHVNKLPTWAHVRRFTTGRQLRVGPGKYQLSGFPVDASCLSRSNPIGSARLHPLSLQSSRAAAAGCGWGSGCGGIWGNGRSGQVTASFAVLLPSSRATRLALYLRRHLTAAPHTRVPLTADPDTDVDVDVDGDGDGDVEIDVNVARDMDMDVLDKAFTHCGMCQN